MNSGKFFRLNLEDSKIVDKVAIYDYIDLPAYFGNPKAISPKYPVSLCITQDALRFQLHYCAYHSIDSSNFYYEIGDKTSAFETVHMQEVVLEIPFANNSMQPVSNIVRDLYNTIFPVKLSATDGSAFFPQLLDRRYGHNQNDNSEVDKLYRSLEDSQDSDPSYSNLWLMGLRRDKGTETCFFDIKNEKNKYVGFLRKLLLDFMFDLKHSEVFQTAAFYQEMYSGLMSDFYFSALMHKCEYYYYRGLTLDAISDVEKLPASSEIEKNKKEERKKFIRELYATKLFEAEKAWVEDITNPLAEQCFKENDDDFLAGESKFSRLCGIIKKCWRRKNGSAILVYLTRRWWRYVELKAMFRTSEFITRPNWFADPEEEMERVCFTMTEYKKEKAITYALSHQCNSETVAEYLGIQKQDGIMDLRAHISRWFLHRNAFSNVLHLHFFRHAHWIIPILVLVLACWIIFSGSTFFSQDWWCTTPLKWWVIATWLVGLIVSLSIWGKPTYSPPKNGNKRDIDVLEGWRVKLVAKRMFWWVIFGGVDLSLFFVAINVVPQYNIWVLLAAVAFFIAALILSWTQVIHIKLVKNVHLLLPRLVASIAAAWLSLAIGNELFQSFFDALPSWLTCGLLSFVVLFFILYEMNKSIPNKSGLVKSIRSVEMLVVSYLVSIVVGLFIINFTGERFMERSGYLRDFHKEYLAKGGDKTGGAFQQDYYYQEGALSKDSLSRDYLDDLKHLTITRHGEEVSLREPVLTYWDVQLGDETHRFFILRDFLIQFAFLAMFIGVFIQMIFEEKTITDI